MIELNVATMDIDFRSLLKDKRQILHHYHVMFMFMLCNKTFTQAQHLQTTKGAY